MRTLIFLCIVALAAARPDKRPEVDSRAVVESIQEFLPAVTKNIQGRDRAAGVNYITSAVVDLVARNAPEEQREQVQNAGDLTASILYSVNELIKSAKIPDIPTVKIPKINIPEISIPEIPEIKIPEIPEFKFDGSFDGNIEIPAIEVPAIEIPEIPDVKIPKVQIPEIDVSDFS